MTNDLQSVIASLREQRREHEGQLDRIDKALAALVGDRPQANSSRAGKPCCTKKEVAAIVIGLLRDNGSLTVAELEGLAKDKVSNELNKSLSGFAMRLKEALREQQFKEVTPGNYALAAAENRGD